jgi:hypothetical protein
MAVALVADPVLAISSVVWEQTQDRVDTGWDVAVVPAGSELDALADRKAVGLHN